MSRDSADNGSKKSRENRKNAQLTAAADVLQGLLQNSKSGLADGFQRWRLEKQWPEVVGATIADQTLPVAFERGILYIWVRHSAWMQQLWYFREPIKDKVNEYLGKAWVQQVKFTLSRRAATTDLKEPLD